MTKWFPFVAWLLLYWVIVLVLRDHGILTSVPENSLFGMWVVGAGVIFFATHDDSPEKDEDDVDDREVCLVVEATFQEDIGSGVALERPVAMPVPSTGSQLVITTENPPVLGKVRLVVPCLPDDPYQAYVYCDLLDPAQYSLVAKGDGWEKGTRHPHSPPLNMLPRRSAKAA